MHNFVDYVEVGNDNNKQRTQKYFLICESCLWCASAPSPQRMRNGTIRKCPSCNADRISMTPILGG
jgi:hypothetical protein